MGGASVYRQSPKAVTAILFHRKNQVLAIRTPSNTEINGPEVRQAARLSSPVERK
jgi:hypothetical protein